METLILPTTVQDCPVDLSTNKSISTMVVPRLPSPVPVTSSEANYPHLRFHHSTATPCHSVHEDTNHSCDPVPVRPSDRTTPSDRTVTLTETNVRKKSVKQTINDVSKMQNWNPDVLSGASVQLLPEKNKSSNKRKRANEDNYDKVKTKRHKTSIEPNNLEGNYALDCLYNCSLDSMSLPEAFYPTINVLENASKYQNLRQRTPETESLLAAVQHSQMLYYSYCSQLFNNLQNKVMTTTSPINKFTSKKTFATSSKEVRKNVNVFTESPNSCCKTEEKQNSSVDKLIPHEEPDQSLVERISTCGSFPSVLEGDSMCGSSGRKRAPRALTGKHVRPGTGASISTLLSLRQKISRKRSSDEPSEEMSPS